MIWDIERDPIYIHIYIWRVLDQLDLTIPPIYSTSSSIMHSPICSPGHLFDQRFLHTYIYTYTYSIPMPVPIPTYIYIYISIYIYTYIYICDKRDCEYVQHMCTDLRKNI
jgi:hypothetical protein